MSFIFIYLHETSWAVHCDNSVPHLTKQLYIKHRACMALGTLDLKSKTKFTPQHQGWDSQVLVPHLSLKILK
jgi:hypothetical protein